MKIINLVYSRAVSISSKHYKAVSFTHILLEITRHGNMQLKKNSMRVLHFGIIAISFNSRESLHNRNS